MRFVNVLAVCAALMFALCGTANARVMPRACPGSTVVTMEGQACCISGTVTIDGKPLEGATVFIHHTYTQDSRVKDGIVDITDYATGDSFPTYGTTLNGFPLYAQPGDELTITASYGHYERTTMITVVEGEQWLDIELQKGLR